MTNPLQAGDQKTLYRKTALIKAAQWFKNGDHPDDYANDVDGFEGGVWRTLPAAECRADEWEGQVVRYYRNPEDDENRSCQHCAQTMHVHGWIDTLEGGHIVCPGDWIATGVQGEHWPIKPDVFAATYEPVSPLQAGVDHADAARIIACRLPIPEAPDTVCIPVTMTAGDLRTIYDALRSAPVLPDRGWRPDVAPPRNGRWIVVIDKWGNAQTIRWDAKPLKVFPDQVRGWKSKGGCGPISVPEMSVAWSYAPDECTMLPDAPAEGAES